MGGEDRYRLEPLREVRERDEQARRGELADAVGDARQTEARLAVLAERVARARARVARAAATAAAATTAATRVLADRYATRRRRELADARDEHARAAAEHATRLGAVGHARATLARARADREVIERHFARWREARRKRADNRDD